jgi:hypothetical protein
MLVGFYMFLSHVLPVKLSTRATMGRVGKWGGDPIARCHSVQWRNLLTNSGGLVTCIRMYDVDCIINEAPSH